MQVQQKGKKGSAKLRVIRQNYSPALIKKIPALIAKELKHIGIPPPLGPLQAFDLSAAQLLDGTCKVYIIRIYAGRPLHLVGRGTEQPAELRLKYIERTGNAHYRDDQA
ncbi:hypothetical protein ADICEAN_03557 [Cesiribacter andamanensis AMV16]|uniref:Uncharacterized protein n=1 Tax=Cesiribacter andamanensis AMV16 TaxID=1279009 RepID=M7NS75_9BACT|nr:hypothetical protein ADICEAN_03557 [Cesiribacter andamanensis AMV16]